MQNSYDARLEKLSNGSLTDLQNTNLKASTLLHYGKFQFSDLKKGQGITFANSLRRVLLYDLSGRGISHLSIKNSKNARKDGELNPSSSLPRSLFSENLNIHEFSTIPGMRESVLEFIFNLRGIVFKNGPKVQNSKISVHKDTPLDFSLKKLLTSLKASPGFENLLENEGLSPPKRFQTFILRAKHLDNDLIVNPEHYLATFVISESLDFELKYLISDGNSGDESCLAFRNELWLPTDGNFFPVKKVNYSILEGNLSNKPETRLLTTRTGMLTNSESVFLEIWTNGSFTPNEALNEGLNILVNLFNRGGTPPAIIPEF